MASDITRQLAVSVGDTATVILPASRQDPIPYLIRNKSTTQTLYLGASDVTTVNGFPVEPGSNATIYAGTVLYGIAPAGQTIDVRTLANRS
jgi:hypothetical protein